MLSLKLVPEMLGQIGSVINRVKSIYREHWIALNARHLRDEAVAEDRNQTRRYPQGAFDNLTALFRAIRAFAPIRPPKALLNAGK
jgi:hypothetical protein